MSLFQIDQTAAVGHFLLDNCPAKAKRATWLDRALEKVPQSGSRSTEDSFTHR